MTLSQRITQVEKDPYLLELLELHQIGVHAQPSPRRTALLLSPKQTDGLNDDKSRENELILSLKLDPAPPCFGLLILEKTIAILSYSLNFPIIPILSIFS